MITGSTQNITVKDFELDYAEKRIAADFGDTVSVDAKLKPLIKFGSNQNVPAAPSGATVMTLPTGINEETMLTSNGITQVSSEDAGDTQEVVIEGHTISGTDLTIVIQTATLNGQTPVALTTPLARATRIYNNDSTDIVGPVYVYEAGTATLGVPDTLSEVHLMLAAGFQQSQKAATAVSQFDYLIISNFRGSVLEKVSAFADVELQIKEPGGVWRLREDISVSSSSGTVTYDFKPYLIVPKNSDVRLFAKGSGANIDVSGSIQGYLAIIQ